MLYRNLKHEAIAEYFRPDKARTASFLNVFKNSLRIHEENAKRNHNRVVSLYVIKTCVTLS